MSAFGRLGQPAEIAAVVAFLASHAAGWVTAQNLRVKGGTSSAEADPDVSERGSIQEGRPRW
jgi:NAD(P)-dependent dehydrogenase (short-subunit alcohol dehydrogenase family)